MITFWDDTARAALWRWLDDIFVFALLEFLIYSPCALPLLQHEVITLSWPFASLHPFDCFDDYAGISLAHTASYTTAFSLARLSLSALMGARIIISFDILRNKWLAFLISCFGMNILLSHGSRYTLSFSFHFDKLPGTHAYTAPCFRMRSAYFMEIFLITFFLLIIFYEPNAAEQVWLLWEYWWEWWDPVRLITLLRALRISAADIIATTLFAEPYRIILPYHVRSHATAHGDMLTHTFGDTTLFSPSPATTEHTSSFELPSLHFAFESSARCACAFHSLAHFRATICASRLIWLFDS